MSFGWDSSVIGGVIVLDPFIQDFGLGAKDSVESANLSANIVSTLQAGCFLGALLASPLTDRFGRKWCLIGISLVIIVGIIMQAAANGNLGPMYAGRFISGVGVGAASTINPIYVSENSPRAIRGLLTGLYQLFIVTGGMIAFWINYSVSIHMTGKIQYIFPLAIQALPAALLCGCMLLCHESPRWLARQDRWEDTKRVLARIRHLEPTHPYVEEEFKEIVDQLEHERQLIGDATFWNLQREMWTIKGNRNRVLISIILMICQQMTGTNAINTYAPTIFKNLGLKGTSVSLFSTGIYGIVKVTSCICFLLFMADSLGRRRSLLWTSIAQGLAMFYIGLYVRISPPVEGDTVPPAGYFALVCIFLFAA
jgi:sugar porter (SP) family MFS transporter